MSKTVKISLVTAFTVVLIAGIIACGGGGGGGGGDAASGPQEYQVSTSTGGSFDYSSSSLAVSLSFPAGAVSADTVITVESSGAIYDSTMIPGLGLEFLPEGLEFDELVTIVVTYDEADLGGADESELKLHRWSDPDWQRLPSTVDAAANTVTATLSGFSEYFLFPALRKLYFTADDGNGDSVWSWDGEELTMGPDTRPQNILGSPQKFQLFNDKLYFVLNYGQLYTFDGAETVYLGPGTTEIIAGAGTVSPSDLLPFNDKLYFEGRDGNGIHLWSYNESAGFNTETYGTTTTIFPQAYMVYDDEIYFEGGNQTSNRELWSYNGIDAPQMVVEINTVGSSDPDWMTAFNGTLYFTADDGIHGRELWTYNASSDIATLVKDIYPGENGGTVFDQFTPFYKEDVGPNRFTTYNGKLYFPAFTSYDAGTNHLWVTDGTANGTTTVANPTRDYDVLEIKSMAVLSDRLYFSARGSYGSTPYYTTALWVYDTTDETSPRPVPEAQFDQTDPYAWIGSVLVPYGGKIYSLGLFPTGSADTSYYLLMSYDGLSAPVAEAYTTTNFTYSQQMRIGDAVIY